MNNIAEQPISLLCAHQSGAVDPDADTNTTLAHLRSTLHIATGAAAAASLPTFAVTGSILLGVVIAVAILAGVSAAGLLI